MPTNFPAYIQDQITYPHDRGLVSQSVPRVMSKSMTCEGVCVYVYARHSCA